MKVKSRTISKVYAEQLFLEFMDQIDKVKPEKKSVKNPGSISYEAQSYIFPIWSIFLINFEF